MTKISNDVMGYKVAANNVVNELRKFKYNEIVVLDGGYAISVDTDDDGNKTVSLWMSTNDVNFMGHETIRTIKMGKRCFGLVDKVISLLETIDSYNEYLMENTMEENDMVDMVNNVDMFNVYVKNVLVEDFKNAVDSAEGFANEYGDTFVENEHICGTMDYDYDIRQMWVDWCWENDVMSRDAAYKYYDANRDMFICEDDLDDIVEGFDGTDDVGDGECLVWVKNPYYVSEDAVKNSSPCLERVVDTIEKYLGSYTPSYLEQFGDCVITVYWDEFNEDDMKMLIDDSNFAISVRDVLYEKGTIVDLSGFLVYDDGVYVSVDYDRMFNKVA